MPVIDEIDLRARDGQIRILGRHGAVEQFSNRAGYFDTGRAGPDDDKVESALIDEFGFTVGIFEHLQDAGSQTHWRHRENTEERCAGPRLGY